MVYDFKDTLNLPKTDFPMKADLVRREPARWAHWEKMDLYNRILEKRAHAPTYILNDGPPYTNGDIHVGTAFNKILKDILLRYKTLRGFRAPFVPVWDCHGLPIEHKVSRELEEQKKILDAAGIREACASFSANYRDKQTSQFQRLGILAEWDKPFQTMAPVFEADILRGFADFVAGGYVYRSKKPVYWSIPCQTALAEGEVEYQDVTSPSIYVAFPVKNPNALGLHQPTFVVIWTTTPWTLPANLAIAAHPALTYAVLSHQGRSYVVAESLVESIIDACGLTGAQIEKKFLGDQLMGLETQHPFIDRSSPVVLADYVLADTGTGFVHTAPGHGLDDYQTGLRYGLDIYSPISDSGHYLDDGQIPKSLVGLSVLTHGGNNQANQAVLELLKQNQALLAAGQLKHSYPHCWRSKTPVITRATHQWFIALDKNDLRKKTLTAIETVKWTPKNGENRIRAAIENRPDWCITRQRVWGTPFIVFYDEAGEAFLDAAVMRAVADKMEQQGSNFWFQQTAEEILDGIETPLSWKGKKLRPGLDTLDVWLDSGFSHLAVLKKHPHLSWPADLYLEGSDQHRGWFNSSLWTGMLTQGQPPYRHVLTHGFIVNEDDRQKISKSGQKKPQTAQAYVDRLGADVLRLWVASENYQNDVPLSEIILTQVTQVYRTIRNTLRFLLGNLYDFDWAKHAVDYEKLTPLDQWALNQLAECIQEVTQAYDQFAFHRAYQVLSRFITVTLSAQYHDILKDRLYVAAAHAHERRCCQTVMFVMVERLLIMLSPILVYTADEAFGYLKHGVEAIDDAVHLQDWPTINPLWLNPTIAAEVGLLMSFREKIHSALEPLRQAKQIGQSIDAAIIIRGQPNDPVFMCLKKYEAYLVECFIVSYVQLEAHSAGEVSVVAQPATGERCPRSWKWVPALVDCPPYGRVSPQAKQALDALLATQPD